MERASLQWPSLPREESGTSTRGGHRADSGIPVHPTNTHCTPSAGRDTATRDLEKAPAPQDLKGHSLHVTAEFLSKEEGVFCSRMKHNTASAPHRREPRLALRSLRLPTMANPQKLATFPVLYSQYAPLLMKHIKETFSIISEHK